jgi:dTDP-4-amino-4,6-dideoxygalactose transaminase
MRELPPTAGLPLRFADIMAGYGGMFSAREKQLSFERSLAEFLQIDEIDLYSSGSLCLAIAFETLKELSGRKRVILPGYTCPLVAIAAHVAGVEPVLCDTKVDSWQFDEAMLAQLCDQSVAAVVPTNIGGMPGDLTAINEIAKASGAYVIEDAAQSLGAKFNGQAAGRCADVAIYSLSAGKGLSLYDGGILAVRDRELRQKMRAVAARRINKQPLMNLLRNIQVLGLWLLYNPGGLPLVYGNELRHWLKAGDLVKAVGENFEFELSAYQYDELRKRMGASALMRLPEFVRQNRQRALRRSELLVREGLRVLAEPAGAEGNWPFIMILLNSEQQRDEVMRLLWTSGLGVTRLFIHDIASYEYLRPIVPRQETPNAHSFAARTFTITNSHWLSDEDFAGIVRTIKSVVADIALVGSGY